MPFNIQIKKIKLISTLDKIVLRPEIYLRTKVKEAVFQAIDKLFHLKSAPNMSFAFRNDLLPTSHQI